MRVIITKVQAKKLRYYENPDFVRACFYLGMGTIQIADFRNQPFRELLMESHIDSAIDMGMTAEDIVVVRE